VQWRPAEAKTEKAVVLLFPPNAPAHHLSSSEEKIATTSCASIQAGCQDGGRRFLNAGARWNESGCNVCIVTFRAPESGKWRPPGKPRLKTRGYGRALKFKSLVSCRSALFQSLEGLTGPLIDHKSWWSPDWYVRRSAARSRLCRPNSCIR
jgi:hypothetical protein